MIDFRMFRLPIFIVTTFLCTTLGLVAQGTQSSFYVRAKLSPQNEVPAVANLDAAATVLVRITVNRDASDNVVSGRVSFNLAYQFDGAVALTGLHIHSGGVGAVGQAMIDSGMGSTADSDGTGGLTVATPLLTNPDQLSALDGLQNNPHLFYVNLATSDHPAGAVRGQITTSTAFFRAALLPANVVPRVTGLDARGFALMTLDYTRDSTGKINSGTVMLDTSFQFPTGVTVTGLHLHSGQNGQNGGSVIDLGVTSFSETSGVGSITRILSLPSDDATLGVVRAIISEPRDFYVDLHTVDHPGGAMRGQVSGAAQDSAIPFSRDDSSSRSNLGIQNLTNLPAQVLVRLNGSDGRPIGDKAIFVPARGFAQINGINPTFGNSQTESALRISGGLHIEAFVSLIDNATNFPALIPLTPDGTRLAIASVTNTGKFRSALVVMNRGSDPVTLNILSRNIDGNVTGQRVGITVNPNGFFLEEDILSALGVSNSYGPLEIVSSNDQPVSAIAIVKSVTENRGSVFAGREF